MPDLIPGSGFDDLLSQVAVPDSNLISNAGFSQTVNPQAAFENAFRQSMQVKQDPRSPEFVSPFSVDPSSRYPLQVIGMDNEDIYAQGQGFFNKAVNATLKGLAIAGTTVAQSTVGLVNGVFQGIADGKFSSFYDNDMNRWLDGINKSLENQLPNYYSAAERNNPWYTNIFTTNFIFDKIVKNMGFMAGASIAGGIFSKLLQAAKATATGNILKTLQATEKGVLEGKTLDTLGDTAAGLGKFASNYNALNKGQRLLVSGLATVGESGMEAIQATDQARQKMLGEFRTTNGRDATGEELKRINDTASNIGNTVFALNTVILTASNYIQFPKLLGASNRAERGMYSEIIKHAEDVGFDPKTLSYVERGSKNKFVKLFNKVRPYTLSVTEGLEEASQYAAQTGSENYWYKKYKAGEEMDLGFAEGASQLFSQSAYKDLLGKGIDEALSPAGQEQFFIGALSGAIGKARGTFREQRENAAINKSFIDQSNRYKLSSYTKDLGDSVKRAVPIAESMDDAVRQGDVLEYKDAERDFLINYLYPKIKHGRLDLFYDEINTYKQLAVTPEGFKQLQEEGKALPTDSREAFLVRLTNLERIAGSMTNAFTGINSRNAFITKPGPDGKPMPKYSETVTNKMVYANSKIQDYDERILGLSSSLGTAGIIPQDVIDNTDKFADYIKTIDDLQTIGGRSVTDDQKVELKTQLKDLVELSMRRKQFIGEYNDMLVNPENWEDVPPRAADAKTKPETVTIKTKDGEEEIVIGEQYLLGKVVKETEEGFLHEKYPTLTVLAVNPDGSLKIKEGNGTIRTISPDELKGYKLGKMSDVLKNPKAVFYLKNKDKIWYFKFKGGKTEQGVLRWSYNKDQLYFEYKKGKKINRIPVRNSDFSYELARKKGYKNPRLTTNNATLTDIAEADALGEVEDKLNDKLAKRMGLITSFVTGSRTRLTAVEKLIQEKKAEFKQTEEALDNLTKTKAGLPRKKYSKALVKTMQVLGDTRNKLTIEISNLEDERDELNAVLPYYEDLLANARELPEDTLELVKELKEEIESLEEIITNTNDAIQQGGELVNNIDEALQRAYSLLNDYIKRLREENPNVPSTVEEFQDRIEKYLGEEGAKQFVENGEGFVPLIKSIQADISEFSEELEIKPNEDKISALQAQIKELQQGLDQVLTEQIAKGKILEFWEEKIKEERARQAEEKAILKNTALQSKIFASQAEIDAYAGDINGDFTDAENQKQLQDTKKADTSRKKSAQVLFSSTSDRSETNVPDAQASPSTIRVRNFLFNQTHFSREVKQNMKGLVVTLANEASLGLQGLVFSIAKQNTQENWHQLSDEDLTKVVTDPDNGVVLLVYAMEKNGEHVFLDENGKEIEKSSKEEKPVKYSLKDAPEIKKEDINWEESGFTEGTDFPEDSKFTLIEYRGRNSKGQRVATVRVVGGSVNSGNAIAESFEVFLNDTKEDSEVDTNQIVASTLTSTAFNWRDGTSRVRSGEEEEAKEIASQWRAKREAFLASTTPQVYDLAFSRGLPIYNETDGTITNTKVEGSLVPANKMDNVIDHQGAIKVITTNKYTHQDIDYDTIPGRVYFEFGDVFAPLSNRQFNKEEQETLYNVIYQLSVQAKDKETLKGELMNYLKNVLFWGEPKVEGKGGRNQIWIDPQYGLVMGNKELDIPFTPISIEQNKEIIMAYLSGTYNNINNHTLTKNFHDVFIEYYMDNGELKTREHPTYQAFLFKNQMVETPIAPTTAVPSNGNRNFMQKYAILQGVEYNVTKKEEPKESIVKKQEPTVTQKEAPKKEAKKEEEGMVATTKKGKKIHFIPHLDSNGKVTSYDIAEDLGDFAFVEQAFRDSGASPEQIDAYFSDLIIKEVASRQGTKAEGVVPSLENKKADIEKRRKQELSNIKVQPLTETKSEGDRDLNRQEQIDATRELLKVGNKVKVDGKEYTVKSVRNDSAIRLEDESGNAPDGFAVIGNFVINSDKVYDLSYLLFQNNKGTKKGATTTTTTENTAEIERIRNEVNAKYDAELAELEKQKPKAEGVVPSGKTAPILTPEQSADNRVIQIQNAIRRGVGVMLTLVDGTTVNTRAESIVGKESIAAGVKGDLIDYSVIKKVTAIETVNEYGSGKLLATKGEVLFSDKPEEKKVFVSGKSTRAAPVDDNEVFRPVAVLSVDRMSEEEKAEFSKFIKDKLPQFDIREISHMITMANGRKAWGKLQGNVITLYELAEKGTGYHEAFEAVWKYFVLPEEQEDLMAEFKNRPGTFNDRITNTTISYAEATDQQAKEELADEFARYKEGQKMSLSRLIKKFFDRIIAFFRSFNRGYKPNTKLRDELFDKIESGEFSQRKINKFSTEPEYSTVRGLSEAETHAYVQDLTKRVFIQLVGRKIDIFEIENYANIDVLTKIKSDYAPTIAEFPSGEQTFEDLWKRTREYLATFNIEFDENSHVTVNDADHTRNEYANDKMTLDVKKSSPFAIKYLLASLAKVASADLVGSIAYDKNGLLPNLYQLLPFGKTFITLLESLEGSTSIDHMITKLKSLSKTNPNFVPLFNMLGNKGGNIDWNNLTASQWRIITNLYNTFNKQRPNARFLHYTEEGQAYVATADIGRAAETTKKQWESNVRRTAKTDKNLFVGYNKSTKSYGVNEKELAKIEKTIGNTNVKIDFLNNLGIKFDLEAYNKLSKEQRASFGNAVGSIIHYLNRNKGLKDVNGKALGISGPLTTLSYLYTRVTNFQSESTFLNADGQQQQNYVQPNYFSQTIDIFNQVYSIGELYKRLPYLKSDPYAQHSEILKLGGKFFKANGERTELKLELGYLDGFKKEQKGRKSADVDYNYRIANQINDTLEGIYEIGVPADSSTGWDIFMGEFVDFGKASSEALFQKAMEDTMSGYLSSEIGLARDFRNHSNLSNVGDKAKELRFFKDILSPNNLRAVNKMINSSGPIEITQSIKDDITKYIKEEVKTLRETLEYENEITKNDKGQFEYRKLLDAFAERKNLSKLHLSEAEVSAIMKFVVGNNIIANMEMHKIFFGDPYNYAIKDKNGKLILDETKRIKSFLSPAIPSLVSDNYNNTFNKEFNTVGNTVLNSKIPGYYKVRNTVNTVTFSDVVTQSQYVEHFTGNNEADAQAYHTLEMHRDLLNRQGQWSKKAEDWYRWEKAYERQQLFKKGVFTDYPEALQVNDVGRLKNPKPEYTLHIVKPIVRGVKANSTFLNPILDKFSSAPLVYSAFEGTNLEKLYTKMFKEGLDYVIFESGRKVGTEAKNNFYNPDGSVNNLPYRGRLTVNWSDYSVQVENSYDKGKSQTRGSQITKLFSLDFFSGGVPIDYEKDDWDSLSEDQKKAASPIYKEVVNNNELLAEMTKHGYETLINRLGLVDTGQNFIVEDYKKLYETLERESLKRDMPENIKKVFQINQETGRPLLPLESTSEYTKIQKMLYSMVDKAFLSPKVNGGPKTQLSAFAWEDSSKGRSLVMKKDGKYVQITREEFAALSDTEKAKVRLTSDTLKFYTKEDPRMEILLPHWMKDKVNKAGFTSDEELLTYLNSSEEGQEILRGVGFRIPTSNMTAIEAIRVKGFLPQELGDTIVVPTEITTKAGSDFDIDKLNTYLKNVYRDGKNIKIVPFFGYGDQAKKKLNEIATKIAVAKEKKVKDALEDFEFTEEDENELLPDVERLYKESLENEYFRSLERMITHPKNFDRLVEPTEDPTLSKLAGELAELTNRVESNKLTRLLSIDYLSKLRHAFLAGKKWVGIGAVNNTGHSQSQRSNQYIDVKNTVLNQRDREILGDGSIALPHNKDSQGRPSLSGVYDKTNKFISSKLGWYLTSFVDIAKDPYILNIIFSRKLVGTFLFLERLGIPTNTIGYFMNQPIIREYVHFTDVTEVNRIASHYYRDKFLEGNSEFNGVADETLKVDNDTLKSNIKAFYVTKKTDQAWKNQQVAILDEFLKYMKMAENVFTSTQATNWDTARFSTGAAVRKKELMLKKQREQNIIKSPDNILDYSNNGKIREALLLSKDAVDSLSIITSPDIREPLNEVLDRYLSLSYISEDAVEKIDSQILNSFIDYLVQTKRNLNGKTIEYLVSDNADSIISRVQAKSESFVNNPIFQNLRTVTSKRLEDAGNIKLAPFPKDVYDKNLINGYLQELREEDSDNDGNIKPNSIYGDLVKLALIQGSGSQANLLSYIPIDDVSRIIQSVTGTVTRSDAENFAKNFNFERSQWRNTDIVPQLQPVYAKRKFPTKFGPRVLVLSDLFDNKNGVTERPVITLNRYHKYNKGQYRYDLTTGKDIPLSTIQSMMKNSDYSFSDKAGYQKVMIPGTDTPLTRKETTDKGLEHTLYYYKQVNLTGSNGIQEHYTSSQPSVLENGTVKVTVLSDQEIVNEVLKVNKPQAPATAAPQYATPTLRKWTRKDVTMDPEVMYIFTDNAARTSGNNPVDSNSDYAKTYNKNAKYPGTTQAVIRGLNNAFPITTMVDDNRTQWTDNRFAEFKSIIDKEVQAIKTSRGKFRTLLYSAENPFGKGQISNMKNSAPKIWEYLNTKLKEIGIDNTGNKPMPIASTKPTFEEFKNNLKKKDCP